MIWRVGNGTRSKRGKTLGYFFKKRRTIPVSDAENELGHAAHLDNDIQFEYMDVTDSASVQRVIKLTQPDEIYNLAGQSQVRISFDIPAYTAQVNALGPLNILETCRTIAPRTKIYQAG